MSHSSRSRKLLSGLVVLSSLLLALAILGDWLPHLRGPAPETSVWYWPYLLRPVVRFWPAAAAALLILAAAGWWISLQNPRRSQTAAALTLLFAGSLLLQASLVYADRADVAAELIDRTLSNQASGFFEAAAEIDDVNYLLANYPQAMPLFVSEHARTHPPGMILSNWVTIQALSQLDGLAKPAAAYVQPLRCTDLWLYDRPPAVSAALGVWALLPMLFAAATVLPAYGVARQLLNGYAVRLATVLAAALPALILFAPKSVQLYAPLTLLMFWAFQSGLLRQSLWRLLAAGMLGSLLTFLSLGNAAIFALLVFYALFVYLFMFRELDDGQHWPPSSSLVARQMLALGVGAISVWLVFWLAWRVPPWEIAAAGLEQHYQLVTNLRSYGWWTGWNLIDLLIFSGWPLALGFAGSLFLAFRYWRNHCLQAVDILAVVLALLILVLNFSGTARGEVGRIWLFFMPLLAFPSAHFWRKSLPDKRYALVIIALQLLMVLCLGWAWQPVRAVIVVAERPPMNQELPQTKLNMAFPDEPLRLTGFTVGSTRVGAGETLPLSLFWEAEGPASRPYTVFNHLLDQDGMLVSQQDNWPVAGNWPPTCWRDGDLIVDTYTLTIPVEAAPGIYHLSSGLYDAKSGARLPLANGRDAVDLGDIEVIPR